MKKLKKIIFINFGVLFFLISSLEIFTGYIINFRRTKESSLIRTVKFFKENSTKDILTLLKNYKGDNRENKIKRIMMLRENNQLDTYPNYHFDYQVHPLIENKFWFSNPSNSTIVYCNEGSGLLEYETNNIGFRKVENQDLKKPIDIILLGDSYAEGACVNNPFDPSSQLSIIRKENILNLGKGGSGPLYQLALLREIIKYKKEKNISFSKDAKLVWLIFTGNDLHNLAEEKNQFLSKYLFSNYSIDYFENILLYDDEQKSFFNEVLKYPKSNKMIGNHNYGETLIHKSLSEKNALNDFKKIFKEIEKIINENKIDLNIIVLADHPQYDQNIMSSFQNVIKSPCNNNCLFISLPEIKSSVRSHLDEKEYKKISFLISKFLDK